jgi:hypothetical protein
MPVIHLNTAGGIVVHNEHVLALRSSLYDHLRLTRHLLDVRQVHKRADAAE